MEIASKLLMLILSKLSLDVIANDYLFELSVIVSLAICHCLNVKIVFLLSIMWSTKFVLTWFAWLLLFTKVNFFYHLSFLLGVNNGEAICSIAEFLEIWIAPPTLYHYLIEIFGMLYSFKVFFFSRYFSLNAIVYISLNVKYH